MNITTKYQKLNNVRQERNNGGKTILVKGSLNEAHISSAGDIYDVFIFGDGAAMT